MFRRNFDGYLIHGQLDRAGATGSYLQVFWTGGLESVNTLAQLDPNIPKRLPALESEGQLLKRLPVYAAALKNLGARPPLFLALSLIGVSGYSIEIPLPPAFSFAPQHEGQIEVDSLILPEVVTETFESDFDEVLKPALDGVWNAAGWRGSIFYEGSRWVGLGKKFPH
jgi:hypothetical protein